MPHHTTYIAGLKFRPAEDREYFDGLEKGAMLALEPDPLNEYDPNAVKVFAGGRHIGFIPKDLAPDVGSLLTQGRVTETLKGEGSNKIRIYYDGTAADEEAEKAAAV